MWLRRPSLAESVVAALCGLWVAFFLVPETSVGIPVALGATGLTLVVPQRPLLAGGALALIQLALTVFHVADGNGAWIAPFVISVYTLGRRAPLWPGVAIAAAFPLAAVIEAPEPGTIAFAIALTGSVFAYGRVVQRRARRADEARAAASELQATDAAALADRIVADERARLGGQSLAMLRDAVVAMRADAERAQADLDPALIEAVATRGRQAVTELRWLLGLLRSTPEAAAPTPLGPNRRWIPDAVAGAVLIASGAVEVVSSGSPSPLPWVLAVCLPLCVATRGRSASIACAAATVLIGGALLAGVPPLVSGLVCVALLAWSAGVAARPVTWGAFAALSAATLGWVAAFGPENIPVALPVLALPAFAGHEWSAQDRAGREAATHADELRAGIDARVERARREERLRVARELHDVTSHAVGVMVLQASAAQALRERDPAGARRALGTVETTAEQAVTELGMMFDLLESGAIGGPGLAAATREPLPTLVERLRGTGLEIELELSPVAPPLVDTVYRIVQESLTNVVRHSDARRVRIAVTDEGDALIVAVVDDGHPIDDDGEQDAGGTRFGLTGLAERVHAAGGTFHAGRAPAGFAVEATIPIEPQVRR